MKFFHIPAGALSTFTAVRLMAFSHANIEGESAFRIRIEDSEFNEIMVEIDALDTAHKFGAQLYKDNNNGLHLFANDVCCSAPGYASSTQISVNRELFVFYEVRIETAGVQWTSDYLVAEYITDHQ